MELKSKLNKNPLFYRFLIIIVLPVLAAVLLVFNSLYSSLPQQQGQILVSGIHAEVRIARDDLGYVSIAAENNEDVFFGMGFAQAQDRLWQLEIQRRTVKGTLSEVFGRSTVDHDIQVRTLDLYQNAERSWDSLSEPSQQSLIAFADGVNAYLQQQSTLPPEFFFLGLEMEPWHPIDSLAWVKMFALYLSGNYQKEIENQAVASVLSPQQIDALFPNITNSEALAQGLNNDSLRQALSLAGGSKNMMLNQTASGGIPGSNAWAVSAQYGQGGRAILSNDPHLGLQIPSLWYGAALNSDALQAKGMALVGLPVIIFGRNQAIAWGGTNLMADVQDLAVEQIKVNQPDVYLSDGRWLTMSRRVERIPIKNDFPQFLRKKLKPIEIVIRKTVNGPLINDWRGGAKQPVALRWTALTHDDSSYQAFYDINFAHDWPSFNAAAAKLIAPALNLIYADVQGNIGLTVAGRIPIREKGNGSLPVPGWDAEFAWKSFIPAEALPKIYNPETGYIVSANDQAYDVEYPHFISNDWAPDARAKRIKSLLKGHLDQKQTLSIKDNIQIQSDTVDLSVKSILPVLQATECQTDRQCEALKFIQEFDGNMAANEVGPAIVTVWLTHLKIQLFQDEFKSYWSEDEKSRWLSAAMANLRNSHILAALNINDNMQPDWCDDQATEVQEHCQDVLLLALDEALDELKKMAGADMNDWQWGKLHHVLYRHNPFSNVKFINRWFEYQAPGGGSVNSINVANASYDPSRGYLQTFGAGFRQVMSLTENGDDHLVMNSTGQSGHFLSEHYDDAVPLYREMVFHELQTSVSGQVKEVVLAPQ